MARTNYIGKSLGMIGAANSGADQCIQCGKCEQHCPQQIAIMEELKNAHKELDSRVMRLGLKIASRIVGYRRD